ncbi:MAG: hypothetical protein HC840_19580 [Leptolyngbyaceae cyanobacterium RM2_2_4]|nr:hypothetical protein [Leptolyngbyaceae cyanobacterium RM2_2_4]
MLTAIVTAAIGNGRREAPASYCHVANKKQAIAPTTYAEWRLEQYLSG